MAARGEDGLLRQALSHYNCLRMKKLIYFLAFFHLRVIAVVIFHGLDSVVHKGWWEKPPVIYPQASTIRYGSMVFSLLHGGKSSEVKIRVFEDGGSVKEYSTLNGFDFYTQFIRNPLTGFTDSNTIRQQIRFFRICAPDPSLPECSIFIRMPGGLIIPCAVWGSSQNQSV